MAANTTKSTFQAASQVHQFHLQGSVLPPSSLLYRTLQTALILTHLHKLHDKLIHTLCS